MEVTYLCDSKACGSTHICKGCKHTSNVEHAINFEYFGDGKYFEKEHRASKPIVVIRSLRQRMKRDEYDTAYKEFKQQIDNGVILLTSGFELAGIVEDGKDSIEFFNLNNPKMSPEEFAMKMQATIDKYEDNWELIHAKHDDLMCNLLKELGYEEGVKIFINTHKWYA